MASPSSSHAPPRHSTRKRQAPERYGFSRENKRRRQRNTDLNLVDLPEDILRTVGGYCSTVSDLFALQTTNKLFRNLSNSPRTRRSMKILSTDDKATIVSKEDTSSAVTRRLLAFAQHGNLDALLMLGRLATYVEDDLECGTALFQRGTDEGDLRCQYELANLLIRNRRNHESMSHGHRLLDQGATAGHAPSMICSAIPMAGEARRALYAAASQEAKSTACLQVLCDAKPKPPRPSWIGSSCSNPSCSRQCYRVRRRRCREWLQQKPFGAEWSKTRSAVLACGTPSPYYHSSTLFCVPDFHVCARCMQADYCGRACQVVHWAVHKGECRPRVAAVLAAAVAAPAVGGILQNNNNNNNDP